MQNNLLKKLNLFSYKNILLMCHNNADLDSFCSAAMFQEFLKKNKISSTIAIPNHINEQTLGFAIKENISFSINPSLNDYDFICLFDFNDFEQIGKLKNKIKKFKGKIIAFDHHVPEKRSISKQKQFVDENCFSTTELLINILPWSNKKINYYACLGIIEDTGRFLVGSKKLFEVFSKCLNKSGKHYSQVFEEAKHKIEKGERIAFLKAIKRSRITKINHMLIIDSNVSFYQGSVATKLLELGADISLVIGKDKDLLVLSARAETLFKEENKFNLMKDLFIPLQKVIGGDVGGHSGAAQWKGNAPQKKVIFIALKILEKKFILNK